jgi:DNA-binding CsgD family transcriptional regulator
VLASAVRGRESETLFLEREAELGQLLERYERAAAGAGQFIVVEGSAGIGKTVLARAGCRLAAARGLIVLQARATPLESELAFGVVRQLLERPLLELPPPEQAVALGGAAALALPIVAPQLAAPQAPDRSPSGITAPLAALHGLYWLVANLAERGPLLLLIDDAHWADSPSLRFVDYLGRRLADIPVAVLLVVRSGEQGLASALLFQLVSDVDACVLEPRPLSESAVAVLVRAGLSAAAAEEFCLACHEVSAGNPFLVHELVAALEGEAVEPTAANAAFVRQIRPATVKRAVLTRLARLGAVAGEIARALAVLGAGGRLRLAAELAGCRREEATKAIEALIAADVLVAGRRLEFVHPLVRTTVYDSIPPPRRALAHARAARLLGDEGAAPEAVAAQLLESEPSGEPRAVEALRAAAVRARAEGAPEQAATYLRRALEEPPSADRRGDILRELALAEAAALDPAAVADLRAALELIDDPATHAQVTLTLARLLVHQGRLDETVQALEQSIARLGEQDRDLTLRLEAELILSLVIGPSLPSAAWERLDRFHPDTEPDGIGKRLLLADFAGRASFLGRPAAEAAAFAEQALADWSDLLNAADGSGLFVTALNVLIWCDRLTEAQQLADQALADAAEHGAIPTVLMLAPFRSDIAYRRGDLLDAEAYARDAIAIASVHGPSVDTCYAAGFLVQALLELGRLDEAAQVLSRHPVEEGVRRQLHYNWILYARGILRLAEGDYAGARDELLACGERLLDWGCVNPAVVPWRANAARAHAALGQQQAASTLAQEEVVRARAVGAPRALGIALRTAGLIDPERSTELLAEAVAVLERSQAPLEHARALTDYGATLRRHGRRTDAREPLRRGLDLARRCHANLLAERARTELLATGARPRRERLTGIDALTASERRIARMAAQAMTNRQIAQQLFISTKTVALHLTHAYQKLDITSRSDLPEALEDAPHT